MKRLILALALTMASTAQADTDSVCVGWTGIYMRTLTYEYMCDVKSANTQPALDMIVYNGCLITQTSFDQQMDAHKDQFMRDLGTQRLKDFCTSKNALNIIGVQK